MASDAARQVGNQIRLGREAKGWTQQQLADKINLTTGTSSTNNQKVSVWERGVNKPMDDMLEVVAGVLGTTVRDLYGRPEPEGTPDPFKDQPAARETDRLLAIQQTLDEQNSVLEDMQQQIAALVSAQASGASGAK